MSLLTCLLVMAGGALGSLARYLVAVWTHPVSRTLPIGTIGINIVGSFLIGFFGTLTLSDGRYPVPESGRIFFMVGICGGFTTFSSFSLQTFDLMRSGHTGRALFNIGLSVLACLLAVAAGHAIAARLNGDRVQIAQIDIEEEA
jgi:CrcB protein